MITTVLSVEGNDPQVCCVQVREALTLLDLDVLIYPCPKGGPTYRPKAQQMSGKAQFPFLVDPNTGALIREIVHDRDSALLSTSLWRLRTPLHAQMPRSHSPLRYNPLICQCLHCCL